MKTLVKKLLNIDIDVNIDFEQRYESIEKIVEETFGESKRGEKEEYLSILLADPCTIVTGMPADCSTFLDGIMQGGLSKGVNYLATSLKAIS